MSQDRTEKPTPKRREDARRKGQIARGAELPGALGFLAALLALNWIGSDLASRAQHYFADTFLHAADNPNLTELDAQNLLLAGAATLAALSLPIIAIALAAGLAANLAQGGLVLTAENLKPKADKFNPAKNIKRIVGADSLVGLLKTALKLVLLAAVCWNVLAPIVNDSAILVRAPVATVFVELGAMVYSVGFRVALILLVFALADYGYQFYKHEKSLRMTKQEIRDEFKEQEGDPLVKGQRSRAARALVQKRSLAEVPRADVVITNPTHFAVALRYNREKDAAPVVVAKGADALAARIRQIARENTIPLMENPPLARALYRQTDIGQTIPIELFGAVAEILAFVFRQKQRSI